MVQPNFLIYTMLIMVLMLCSLIRLNVGIFDLIVYVLYVVGNRLCRRMIGRILLQMVYRRRLDPFVVLELEVVLAL